VRALRGAEIGRIRPGGWRELYFEIEFKKIDSPALL